MMWKAGGIRFFATINDPNTERRDALMGLKWVNIRHNMR
jgi:hypothetical protein